jgi:predicted nucleotidyltransferase
MTKVEQVFEQLKKMKPQAIIVFGSYAWGKPHEDSDLDVLMVKDTTRKFTDRIRDVHMKIKTLVPLDVIVLTPREAKEAPQKSEFFKQIIHEGELIYGKI